MEYKKYLLFCIEQTNNVMFGIGKAVYSKEIKQIINIKSLLVGKIDIRIH